MSNLTPTDTVMGSKSRRRKESILATLLAFQIWQIYKELDGRSTTVFPKALALTTDIGNEDSIYVLTFLQLD